MELLYIGLILGVIAFFAHIIKGLTGFGPAIVFVSLGSLIYNPVEIIVLAALLDIIGGTYLSILNFHFFKNRKYWIPVGLSMIFGAIIGALILYLLPPYLFESLLGLAIISIAVWFLFGNSNPDSKDDKLHKFGVKDGSVGIFSGFCGGFTGMGGPPLIIYMGSRFEKELFRSLIVPIFLMAAVARFSSYGFLGMINLTNPWIYIIPSLGVVFGNYIGDHFFKRIDQKWFTILIGAILLFSGIKLIIS